jgi:hypothetical protein
MPESEPPSTRLSSPQRLFRVGRDSRGNWVAQDQQGLCGGLFAKRADALKFAMFENGNRPQAVIVVPDVIELDMSAAPRGQAQHRTPNTNPPLQRVA